MAAADGSFCKHCVAVAYLLGSGPSDEEQVDVALDVDPVESYVRSCLLYTSPSPRDRG